MIKIEDVEVMGMRKAIKGMRNAMNSWDKSDSIYCGNCSNTKNEGLCIDITTGKICNGFIIGKADMKLAKSLIKSGKSHRKYMRMIHVQADITAPLYWWKEYDTYKVGTTTNSCSTMHTIHKKEFTLEDFSYEHLTKNVVNEFLYDLIEILNEARECYLTFEEKTKDGESWDKEIKTKKDVWWHMIQLLPSSFNQMRTIDLSYETLFSIYQERKNHKLDEWKEFCKWIESLPYMSEFLVDKQ